MRIFEGCANPSELTSVWHWFWRADVQEWGRFWSLHVTSHYIFFIYWVLMLRNKGCKGAESLEWSCHTDSDWAAHWLIKGFCPWWRWYFDVHFVISWNVNKSEPPSWMCPFNTGMKTWCYFGPSPPQVQMLFQRCESSVPLHRDTVGFFLNAEL